MVEKTHNALELAHGLSHGHFDSPEGPLPEISVDDTSSRFATEFEALANPVHRPNSVDEVRDYVLDLAAKWKEYPIAISDGLPIDVVNWLAEEGFDVISPSNEGDNRDAIARCGIGITGCDWAIAETGSIVLRSGPGHPRLHSLLPETHLALIPEKNILPHISSLGPEFERILINEGASPSCVNFITGPSRSADIALTLIKGVHGPRDVFAIIVPDSLTAGNS